MLKMPNVFKKITYFQYVDIISRVSTPSQSIQVSASTADTN